MIVVLDTNVLVSALLSPFGHPARVLDLVLAGEVDSAHDDRTLAEYRAVLRRERFGFDPGAVDDLLRFLTTEGTPVIARPWPGALPDPDDLPFLEVAAAAAATLVTGNVRHFPAEHVQPVPVMTPAAFVAAWSSGAGRSGGREPSAPA